MDINTLRKIIRQETPARIEVGTVISADYRGVRQITMRLAGGRTTSQPHMCPDDLEPGDLVILAHLEGVDRMVVIGRIQDEYSSNLSRNAILGPPLNLVAIGFPMAVYCEWESYPGESTPYIVEESDDGGATSTEKLVTRGSYYLHLCTAEADHSPETWHFRVRAMRWLGDNNVQYSGWSNWVSATSKTWDQRYYREDEISSAVHDEGAALSWIEDAGGYFDAQVSNVELALQDLAEGGGETVPPADNEADILVADAALAWYPKPMSQDVGIDAAGLVTVEGIQTRQVAGAAPADGQLYIWNASTSQWEPKSTSQDATNTAAGSMTVQGIRARQVSGAAPTNNQVYSWNTGASEWQPQDQSGTGTPAMGGGNPSFHVDGPITTAVDAGGTYLAGGAGTIDAVGLYLKDKGSASSTIVDVNLNGVTIFTTQANRPEVDSGDPDNYDFSPAPDVTAVVSGDRLSVDIDQTATGAIDVDVIVYMTPGASAVPDHSHSGGPHTGEVIWSEQDQSEFVPRVTNRQGGSATDWTSPGAASQTISQVREQVGTDSVSVPGLTGSNPWKHKSKKAVTFPTAYPGGTVPQVFLSVLSGNYDSTSPPGNAQVRSITNTGFEWYGTVGSDLDVTITTMWRAIGPYS